jgi:hypothetical protein
MTKLDSKTLDELMLEASIQYPKNTMLHRALLSARNRLQEIELAKATEERVAERKNIQEARAHYRREVLTSEYDEPADADPDGASNVDISKATDL